MRGCGRRGAAARRIPRSACAWPTLALPPSAKAGQEGARDCSCPFLQGTAPNMASSRVKMRVVRAMLVGVRLRESVRGKQRRGRQRKEWSPGCLFRSPLHTTATSHFRVHKHPTPPPGQASERDREKEDAERRTAPACPLSLSTSPPPSIPAAWVSRDRRLSLLSSPPSKEKHTHTHTHTHTHDAPCQRRPQGHRLTPASLFFPTRKKRKKNPSPRSACSFHSGARPPFPPFRAPPAPAPPP